MNDRGMPYGSYSETIPTDKLIELTQGELSNHPDYVDEDVRKYAKQVVEKELGPQVASSENIVDAIVEEILRKSNK